MGKHSQIVAVYVNCDTCNKQYKAKAYDYKRKHSNPKGGKDFCSVECFREHLRKNKKVPTVVPEYCCVCGSEMKESDIVINATNRDRYYKRCFECRRKLFTNETKRSRRQTFLKKWRADVDLIFKESKK